MEEKQKINYKQIIIARKDLQMSPGKLAAQVSHGSMAFLTNMIREKAKKVTNEKVIKAYEYKLKDENTKDHIPIFEKVPILYRRADLSKWAEEFTEKGEMFFCVKPVNKDNPYGKLELCEPTFLYEALIHFDDEIYENWIDAAFAKTVLSAKNRNQLLKAKTMAEEMGMIEGKDFWLIKDNCRTELEPEEVDENGVGRCLTVIGFKPMSADIIDKIGKKYQLYK